MKEGIRPLTFYPIFKEKIWGGNKIKTILGKDYGNLSNCGETWEISGVDENISIISGGEHNGKNLIEIIELYGADLVGGKVFHKYGTEFPLLIKFIDANRDLSIQVHPNDELARERHSSYGKTEMWYVLNADTGAKLISGFNRDLSREEFLDRLNGGRLEEVLNKESVFADDVFLMPAGRVHSIGKGALIAEIQQTSDFTYRIYDFDRVDADGKKRELHVQEALDAIDYKKYDKYKTQYQDVPNERVKLESCPYFETNKLSLSQDFEINLPDIDSFKIYICLEGAATLEVDNYKTALTKGEVVLVPAKSKQYTIQVTKNVKLLETYIP